MSLPTFIIPGAPKCGTTALWYHLNDHPEVCMASIKEPRFFSKMQGELENGIIGTGPIRSGNFNKGFEWYKKLFGTCSEAKAIGEASTYYFSAIDSAKLIKKFVPEIRLIFLLRDPVYRTYSHYWEEYKLGWGLPDFEDMFNDDHPRFRYYCYISSYKIHLERFFSYFSSDQITIFLDKDLREDPHKLVKEAYKFIGVDHDYIPSSIGRNFNIHKLPKIRSLARLITISSNTKFADSIPDVIRFRIRKWRKAISNLNSRPNQYPPIPRHIRYEMVKRFEDDILFVEKILNRNLSIWRDF
jgi:hypothetical protein